MEKILTEDDCLRDGLDFKTELNNYISMGYEVEERTCNPAVGKIIKLVKK